MDNAIQIATVLAAFSAVHERLVELLQQLASSRLQKLFTLGGRLEWNEETAIAWKNALLAIALSLATRASFLELFQYARLPDGTSSSLFFVHYMQFDALPEGVPPWRYDLRSIAGCVLMGLSTGLGSKFWHDLTQGLSDLRDRAKEVSTAASGLHLKPPAEPPRTLGASSALGAQR
jgi:hypothetical protein